MVIYPAFFLFFSENQDIKKKLFASSCMCDTRFFCVLQLLIAAADFKELKELYGMEESHIEHRNEGPKSDYYDPLKHGNRESNRQ